MTGPRATDRWVMTGPSLFSMSSGTSSLRAPAHHEETSRIAGGPARRSAAGPTLQPVRLQTGIGPGVMITALPNFKVGRAGARNELVPLDFEIGISRARALPRHKQSQVFRQAVLFVEWCPALATNTSAASATSVMPLLELGGSAWGNSCKVFAMNTGAVRSHTGSVGLSVAKVILNGRVSRSVFQATD